MFVPESPHSLKEPSELWGFLPCMWTRRKGRRKETLTCERLMFSLKWQVTKQVLFLLFTRRLFFPASKCGERVPISFPNLLTGQAWLSDIWEKRRQGCQRLWPGNAGALLGPAEKRGPCISCSLTTGRQQLSCWPSSARSTFFSKRKIGVREQTHLSTSKVWATGWWLKGTFQHKNLPVLSNCLLTQKNRTELFPTHFKFIRLQKCWSLLSPVGSHSLLLVVLLVGSLMTPGETALLVKNLALNDALWPCFLSSRLHKPFTQQAKRGVTWWIPEMTWKATVTNKPSILWPWLGTPYISLRSRGCLGNWVTLGFSLPPKSLAAP